MQNHVKFSNRIPQQQQKKETRRLPWGGLWYTIHRRKDHLSMIGGVLEILADLDTDFQLLFQPNHEKTMFEIWAGEKLNHQLGERVG